MTQQEFDNHIAKCEEYAQAGSAEAMMFLGDALYQGPSGKEQNLAAALPHWKRAADHGELSVATKVAYAYFLGSDLAPGCKKDEKEAFKYFLLGADYGDKQALYMLGEAYAYGMMGCTENEMTAIKYYRQAAIKGDAKAMLKAGEFGIRNKTDDWVHWICAAHIHGVQEATDWLNHMIQTEFPKDAVEWQIEQIKKYGIDPKNHPKQESSKSESDGCYVATCVYGSYDCPQVWVLRRFRDNALASTFLGRVFIRTYYAVSPTIVKWFGATDWFRNFWRSKLDNLVQFLYKKGVEDTPYHDRRW